MQENESLVIPEMITIHIPERIDRALRRDAEYFEIYKRNGEVNYRGFLSQLLIGYHERYQIEMQRKADRIKACVEKEVLNPEQAKRLTRELLPIAFSKEESKAGQQKKVQVSLRQRKDTSNIITSIIQSIPASESWTPYFCDMFSAYCDKPIYERERIIFFKNTEAITKACEKEAGLIFSLTGRPAEFHKVIPYEFVYGSDELYNYLLCQEWSNRNKRYEARAYRLCRILEPRLDLSMDNSLDSDVKKHLEMMKKYGPQYLINEDIETCVRLTKEGRDSFRAIYQGRPVRMKKGGNESKPDEKGNIDYYFECSQTQLYLYFRRFNPKEATILYPESLKKKLREFHQDHLEYMKGKK